MVRFFFSDVKSSFTERQRIKNFIPIIFKKEHKPLHSLNYIFCSDEYLLNINRKFLNHDYFTDIITFNLAAETTAIVGEIYISLDRLKDNAKLFKLPFKEELLRILFHGALHLCGYDDRDSKTKAEMTRKENEYLDLFKGNVPRGT